jgi:predicted SAM-dependent methyltransferase
MKLNLGCGPDVRKGFTNCDIRDLPGVDVVVDVADLHGFEAVDYIMALDVLEHMPQVEAEKALVKWVSLLELGGTIEIQCPDVVHAAKIAYSDEWLIQLLYGGQDYPENFHKSGFTLATMKKLLKGLGLEVIFEDQTKSGNLHVKAVKCG